MEKTVAAIWQEVLGVSGIGCDQNFFDAGGDSLLIARVQSKLVSELGRPVAMTDLFIHSTVSALAAALDQPEPEDKQPDEARWRAEKRRAARPRHVAVEVDKPMEEITL
jgi:acyl carrier protein